MLRKETVLGVSIHERVPELTQFFMSCDKSIPGGCSLHRPDLLYEMLLFWLSIECDENGHGQSKHKYDLIQNSMGGRHGILLRINPDGAKPMFKRKRLRDGTEVYQASEHFNEKMDTIEEVVRARVLPMMGLDSVPPSGTISEIKLFFKNKHVYLA